LHGVRRPGTGRVFASEPQELGRRNSLMKHVSLGGLDVSRIGLGAMTMAGTYTSEGGLDDAESIRTIHRALDLGVTHIDTAEIYGPSTAKSWSAGPSRAVVTRWS
jgi:aryl-alcohol dehydrogenase-like predicted oxidoreductase